MSFCFYSRGGLLTLPGAMPALSGTAGRALHVSVLQFILDNLMYIWKYLCVVSVSCTRNLLSLFVLLYLSRVLLRQKETDFPLARQYWSRNGLTVITR